MKFIPGPLELIILLPLLGLILMIWLMQRKQNQSAKTHLTVDGQLASDVAYWRRLANFVIDLVLIYLIIFGAVTLQQGNISQTDSTGLGFVIAFLYYFRFFGNSGG